MKAALTLFTLLGLSVAGQTVSISTPPPPAPTNLMARYTGPAGSNPQPVYYWAVARYSTGLAPSVTSAVVNVPGGTAGLSVTNTVVVSWASPSPSVTGTDIVRSATPIYPGTCGTCGAVLNAGSSPVTDTGSQNSYPPAGMSNAGAATGIVSMNNQDPSAPYPQIAINGQGPVQLQTGQSAHINPGTTGQTTYYPSPGSTVSGASVNGIIKGNAGTGAPTPAASGDVISLFTSCSGTQYLGADGACHTPSSGTGTVNPGTTGQIPYYPSAGSTVSAASVTGIVKGNAGSGAPTPAGSGDVISLFTSCTGTQYLGADGACHTPSSGTGTVNPGTTGQLTYYAGAGSTVSGTSVTGIVKGNAGSGAPSPAGSSDVISLFSTCSGTQYLGADGACHTASAGGASVGTFASLPAESDGATYVTNDSVYTFYGSGGNWIPFIPSQAPGNVFLPPSSGWSFINQGGASVTTTRGGIDLVAPANAANTISFYSRTAISPPWTVDALIDLSMQGAASNPEVGLLMYESGSGKFLEYVLQGGTNNLAVLDGTALSSGASGTVVQVLGLNNANGGAGYKWFQFSYDNSAHTVTFRFSGNGRDWIVITSQTVTTWFTTAPDTYGIVVNPRNGSYNVANWLVSWNERNAVQ